MVGGAKLARRDTAKTLALALATMMGLGGACEAACRMTTTPLGPAVREQFRETPKSLLQQYPQGGPGMAGAVADMAAASPRDLVAVVASIADASANQRKAIGEGFAQASQVCAQQDPSTGQRIADAVKTSGSVAVQRAFLLATLDDTAPAAATASAAPPAGTMLPMKLAIPSSSFSDQLADPFGSYDAWH